MSQWSSAKARKVLAALEKMPQQDFRYQQLVMILFVLAERSIIAVNA